MVLYDLQWKNICHSSVLLAGIHSGNFLNYYYMYTYYDYILASGKNGTLYNGVTNNLIKRVAQHKRKEVKGFTEKYGVNKLV